MYRKKITGFYIFAIATFLMPFWELIIKHQFQFSWQVFLFSLVSIGLFALHFFVFAPKKKLEVQESETTTEE